MTAKLNHTIVHSRDPQAGATFMSEILGLPKPEPFGPFLVVQAGNEVSLDFLGADGEEIAMQHYAFLVSEPEFDEIFGRIRARNQSYWADPYRRQRDRINTQNGRGIYFEDPSGHLLEILTRPYGSGEKS